MDLNAPSLRGRSWSRGPGQSGPRAHPTLVIREGLDRKVMSPYAYNGVTPHYLTRVRRPEGDTFTVPASRREGAKSNLARDADRSRGPPHRSGADSLNGAHPRSGNSEGAVRAVPRWKEPRPMNHVVTVQDAVTAFAEFMEPTDAELDAIEQEMPAILAGVELLDAYILTLDRTPTELDARRIRRARRRALAARVALVNRTAGPSLSGGAA